MSKSTKKRRTTEEQISYHEEQIRVKKSRVLMGALKGSDEGKKLKRLVYDLNWLRRKSKDEKLHGICKNMLERMYAYLAERFKTHQIKASDIAQAVDSEYETAVEADVPDPTTSPTPPQ